MWTLKGADREAAYRAMITGNSFTRGNVTMFYMDGEYCVIRMGGPVTPNNRLFTKEWGLAIKQFERFMEEDGYDS